MRTGHLAISLGLGTELLNGVQSGALQADPNALHQWRFRLARGRKENNPYRHLLTKELFEQVLVALANSKLGKNDLRIELNGGIGDHLEALSLILPWARLNGIHLDLIMSEERQDQIKALIPQCEKIRCITKNKCKPGLIPIMAMRAALMEEKKPVLYSTWIPKPLKKSRNKHHYLCCWRAEGVGDRFSAHSRSIPSKMVYNFYKDLIINNQQTRITDITYWTKWEKKLLRSLGVNLIDPRQGSLIDLIKQCQISQVITIDTALAHLCAASGIEANLLLSLFPDERWQELHRPQHNYGQLLKLWRSPQFGSWSTVLCSLTTSLVEEG